MAKKILVVDDMQVVRDAYHERLTAAGYVVFTASGWDEAYDYLFEEDMDLLLVDVEMPVLHGDQLAKILLSKLVPPPKIVLFSAIAEDMLRQKAEESGCAGYIHKSFHQEKILERLSSILETIAYPAP